MAGFGVLGPGLKLLRMVGPSSSRIDPPWEPWGRIILGRIQSGRIVKQTM